MESTVFKSKTLVCLTIYRVEETNRGHVSLLNFLLEDRVKRVDIYPIIDKCSTIVPKYKPILDPF